MATVKTPHSPQIVFTGEDGNVFAWTPVSKRQQQLTWSWEEHEGKKETAEDASIRLTHMWPAWAPDGNRIACFGMRGTSESHLETSLYAVAADGIESWELSGLSGGMPIYGNWSPQGNAFAALVQRAKKLSLEIVSLNQPGTITPVISGAPLFWSWSPQGDKVAVHVGGSHSASGRGRVVVVDTTSGQILRQVTDRPGEFRVPAWSPQDNLLTYVERDDHDDDILFLYDIDTGEKGPVTASDSNTVAVWSADGRTLAFSSTARSGSSMFPQVQALDLTTGRRSTILDEPVLGFFWSPQGDFLLYLTVDQQQNFLCWNRFVRTNGEKTEIARFLPSREQMFILSFFDQYALSHPPLAPDGSALAFAGYLVTPVSATTTSHVYYVSLDDPTTPPTKIAPGQFVSWNL